MKSIFNIKVNDCDHALFAINPEKAAELGIYNKRRAFVSFGNRKCFVDMDTSYTLEEDTILLPKQAAEDLCLPDYLDYEISIDGNEIILGPYIGIVASSKSSRLTRSRLKHIEFYTKYYSGLHGAIVVFALDGVDKENRLVEGYCHNPRTGDWEMGKFPYPSAIYRRTVLNEEWQNHFLNAIGDRVFNYHFNKWDMYEWFSKDPDMNVYVPNTMLYRSHDDALGMLMKYGRIFMKPLSRSKGRGVVQMTLSNGTVEFAWRENGVNREGSFRNIRDIRIFMDKLFKPGKFIAQQAVDLLRYGDSVVDFRCVMQKNQTSGWKCKLIVGRCGPSGSVVSNISAGGSALIADELLRNIYVSSGVDTKAIERKIKIFALKVCEKLDQYGIRTGNLGLDIALDDQGCLWLIEINNRDPEPLVALDIHDRVLYADLRITPLFYAKAVAGFRLDED